MSFGKGGGTTVNQAQPSAEQLAQIAAQTNFFTGTVAPAYQQAVGGAQDIYNANATGVNAAAQNLAGTAGQAQEALGGTGESALRTGISGLESVFDPAYQQRQIDAALQPAQAQYQQNLAGQNAQFGGAGQLGSYRSTLANQALAGSTQAQMANATAGVMNNVANQRAGVGSTLAQLGQSGIGQSVQAAGTQLTAANSPQDLYNKYASIIFGTPAASYSPNFSGTGGSKTSSSTSNFGISI
jgi:hypothetical protein